GYGKHSGVEKAVFTPSEEQLFSGTLKKKTDEYLTDKNFRDTATQQEQSATSQHLPVQSRDTEDGDIPYDKPVKSPENPEQIPQMASETIPQAVPEAAPKPAPEPKSEQMELFREELLRPESRDRIRVIGQLFDTYWLAQFGDRFYIIDQHAAH